MHAVDRGPAPAGLGAIRTRHTAAWIRYYQHGLGRKPTDAKWRAFQPQLRQAFFDICGYCEEYCKGDVDHFRPKSLFPARVYEWSNWILACHVCNQKKSESWPTGGYVHPCATSVANCPEEHFEVDTLTAQILPKRGLSGRLRKKAKQTIDDLGLNRYFHLKRRNQWLFAVEQAISSSPDDEFFRRITARRTELSSLTRQFLIEKGLFEDSG
jgi:uncharacterized protein (TIGR02646 family)